MTSCNYTYYSLAILMVIFTINIKNIFINPILKPLAELFQPTYLSLGPFPCGKISHGARKPALGPCAPRPRRAGEVDSQFMDYDKYHGLMRYGGFLKLGYPQIIHFRLVFSIINHPLRVPHLWKPSYFQVMFLLISGRHIFEAPNSN